MFRRLLIYKDRLFLGFAAFYNLKLSGLSCPPSPGLPWGAEVGSWNEEVAQAGEGSAGAAWGLCCSALLALSAGSRQEPWAPFQAKESLQDLAGISYSATSLLS